MFRTCNTINFGNVCEDEGILYQLAATFCPSLETEKSLRNVSNLHERLLHVRATILDANVRRAQAYKNLEYKLSLLKNSSQMLDEYKHICKCSIEKSIHQWKTHSEIVNLAEMNILKLKIEKAFLRYILLHLQHRFHKFEPVRKYLEDVRDFSNGKYSDVKSIVTKFDSLIKKRSKLLQRFQDSQQKIEEIEVVLRGPSTKDSNEEYLQLLEQYDDCLKRKNLMDEKLQTLYQTLEDVKSKYIRKVTLPSVVQNGINGLITTICDYLKYNPNVDTLEDKMKFIKGVFNQLKDIKKEASKIMDPSSEKAIYEFVQYNATTIENASTSTYSEQSQ